MSPWLTGDVWPSLRRQAELLANVLDEGLLHVGNVAGSCLGKASAAGLLFLLTPLQKRLVDDHEPLDGVGQLFFGQDGVTELRIHAAGGLLALLDAVAFVVGAENDELRPLLKRSSRDLLGHEAAQPEPSTGLIGADVGDQPRPGMRLRLKDAAMSDQPSRRLVPNQRERAQRVVVQRQVLAEDGVRPVGPFFDQQAMDDRIEHGRAALRRFAGDLLDNLPARPGEDEPLETASGFRMNEGDISNLDRAGLILHGEFSLRT